MNGDEDVIQSHTIVEIDQIMWCTVFGYSMWFTGMWYFVLLCITIYQK